jgi:thioesterase domain-containing protein
VKWSKYLRSAYADVPGFLVDFEAEARKASPVTSGDATGAGVAALAGLSHAERQEALERTILQFARDVVESDDLTADAALLESGMDSLSGVEFRNRLVTEFDGVKLPNSVVFDHPTASALAAFVNSQLGDVIASAAPAAESQGEPVSDPVIPVQILEQLNDRSSGSPLFLVPGAGMQAGGFRSLASLLPVPVHGFSWPKGIRPRAEWPSTLAKLAEVFLREARKVQPSGPLFVAGHSFGASVALEMVRLAEKNGEQVAIAILLDPRNLAPLTGDIAAEFGKTTLVDSMALLSQTVPDGSKYAEQLESIAPLNKNDQEATLRTMLSSGMMASLEHIHETSQWYTDLLHAQTATCAIDGLAVACKKVVVMRTQETWLQTSVQSGEAEKMVRDFMGAVFQTDTEVTKRVADIVGDSPVPVAVPGTHFSMLHEPHVATLALKMCSKLDDAGALGH